LEDDILYNLSSWRSSSPGQTQQSDFKFFSESQLSLAAYTVRWN